MNNCLKMATTSEEDSDERSYESKKYDAELDFSSPSFNPERALMAPTISVPYPDIKSFPSLNSYQSAIEKRRQVRQHSELSEIAAANQDQPITNEKRKQTACQVQHSSDISTKHSSTYNALESNTRRSEKEEITHPVHKSSLLTKQDTQLSTVHTRLPVNISKSGTLEEIGKSTEKHLEVIETASTSKPQAPVKKRNVFARMENVEGPLTFLRRCVEEHLLVRVVTRGAVLVRGVCRGYVVAFDKYFNMAMIDVDEIYRRPPALGKIRARRSHKMMAAKKVLHKEREDYQTKWKEQQNALAEDVNKASSSLQALNLLSSLINSSINQPAISTATDTTPPLNQKDDIHSRGIDPFTTKLAAGGGGLGRFGATEDKKTVAETTQRKVVRLQSVYEGTQTPFSPFEREALLLGIPDENVKIRHVNQLFIRGDNVVSVSIVVDL